MLAFRVSRSFDELPSFITKLSESSTHLIVYEHDATRVHIHGLVKDLKVSTDTLKNWIKHDCDTTKFPKSDWSFITKDKQGNPVNDSFITYMSKGDLQPRYCKGFDSDVVEQYRLQWKPITKQKVQYILKQENPHEAKKRQIDMIDEIVRRVESQKIVLTEDIIKVICDVVYKENRTIVGRYKIRDYYDMVVYCVRPQGYIELIKNLCLKI